jgi:hypothetical protein
MSTIFSLGMRDGSPHTLSDKDVSLPSALLWESARWDSNPHPRNYEFPAPPLSYRP